jgi:hypothetical protein
VVAISAPGLTALAGLSDETEDLEAETP